MLTLEIRETLINACKTRVDKWGAKVKYKLLSLFDLVAAEARYHGSCYKKFCKSKLYVGRPKDDNSAKKT